MANSPIRWAASSYVARRKHGACVYTPVKIRKRLLFSRVTKRKTMRFADGSELEVDFIVFSTGIRPATAGKPPSAVPAVAQRGGIKITTPARRPTRISTLSASAPVGTTAFTVWSHRAGKSACAAVDHISSAVKTLLKARIQRQPKLLGVDVGGIGATRMAARRARVATLSYLDESKEVYKRLIVSEDNKTLLGVILVGDTSDSGNLLQLRYSERHRTAVENPDSLILPPTRAVVNPLSAWINPPTARRSAPASM